MYDKLPRTLFICSVVVCLVLRVWIKLSLVDPTTGFYTNSMAMVFLFNGLLFSSAVVLFAQTSAQKTMPSLRAVVPWHSMLLRVTAVACAVGAWVCAGQASFLMYDYFLSTFNFGATGYMMIQWSLGFFIQLVLFVAAPAISGYLWIQLALHSPNQKPVNAYLGLVPVIWQGALAIYYFMKFTSMRNVSDQQLSIAVAVLAVPFLLAYARLISSVDTIRGLRQIRQFGYVFALIAMVVSAGMIAAVLAERTVTEGFPTSLSLFFYPALALHAVVLLLSLKENNL